MAWAEVSRDHSQLGQKMKGYVQDALRWGGREMGLKGLRQTLLPRACAVRGLCRSFLGVMHCKDLHVMEGTGLVSKG